MAFFVWLTVYGALAGVVYALIALMFVVVYKASRAINFAIGEWIMFGALLTGMGLHTLGMARAGAAGLVGAMLHGAIIMAGLAIAFAHIVPGRTGTRSPMALVMLTLGLGAVMRGTGAIIFKGTPNSIVLPGDPEYVEFLGLPLPPERLLSALIAALCIGIVGWFYQYTRTGLALRAIAANPLAARGAGIDVNRHISISWAMAGLIAVVGGVLWSVVSGGGFGTALVGLKVFPIVIIGGLNSIAGCIVGAMLIGVVESLASGYLDPILGSGVSVALSGLLLLMVLWVRPHGLFGDRLVARV